MIKEKKLFLLDAYALIYRAYYAFINNPIYNSKGFNTSTVFGFMNSFEEIMKSQNPEYIAVAFDSHSPTFRHKIFPDYKANRLATPEEIRNSIPVIRKILELMNIEILESEGYEADDIIGTVARQSSSASLKVYMVTPDKDYCQLVDENIFIYKPKKSGSDVEIIGINEVNEKFSVKSPAQVIDILALWGDASDNIPGVPGIGEKTAKKLISEYNSIENLIENVDKLNLRIKKSIQENIDILLLSKKLVTIDTKAPIKVVENRFQLKDFNPEPLIELFNELNFKSLINKFFHNKTVQQNSDTYYQGNLFDQLLTENIPVSMQHNHANINSVIHKYHTCLNIEEVEELVIKLNNCSEFCFDTETTGLNPYTDFLIGISFSIKIHEAYYVPIPDKRIEDNIILEALRPALENPSILKIGHNLKFDILFLKKFGIYVKGDLFDTMLAHYLIQPEQNHKMDSLAEKYLGYHPIPIEDLIGAKGASQLNMKNIPIEKVSQYSCEDADITFQLKQILNAEVIKLGLDDLFFNIECRLLKVLIDVEYCGFKIDIAYLKTYSKTLKHELETIEQEIYNLSGGKFNISSPKQLGEILFEKLKIPYTGKLTKTKQYHTNEEILHTLIDKHPIIKNISEYRSISKLLSTYVEALPKLVDSTTGKIHTTFNQSLTITGRLSSNNPNLQNIPIREERGREIRNAFIPTSNEFIILSADYSQIELRLMAHISGDENMIQAFLNNTDIHISTASKIFKVPLESVTKEQRSKAKTANFGIIYGISAFGLSQRMNIPRKEAHELIDEYFRNFPGIRQYMMLCISKAREFGYVETIMKRRRYLPEVNSQNSNIRGMAERNAINTPIQGSAADIIKLAMILIFNEINNLQLKSKMILQVHDELVFDVLKEELETVKNIVKNKMENAVSLSIPLLVEIGTGNSWNEAH
jgi:DNA polymerase I